MSQRRTLILIAAIVVGALASFLVWNYVGGIQDQAYDDAEQVKVYLVKQEIPRGTSGGIASASIVEETIPRKFRPANAINDLADISGKVARADLVPNQVVVADMFVAATDPDAQASFAEKLTKIQNQDQVTYTLAVDDIAGVAGLVVPGDYVNIMLRRLEGAGGPATEATGNARFVYEKAQVLAVGQQTVGESNAPVAEGEEGEAAPEVQAGVITLIVPTEAAQVLASVDPLAIYLSLVSKDYEPQARPEIDITTLPAENPDQLTPYGPDGARTSD